MVTGVNIDENGMLVRDAQGVASATPEHARLERALAHGRLELTSHVAAISDAEFVVIAVPMPVDSHLVPDMRGLTAACASVVANAVQGQVIVLTSTTYVGCTRDLIAEPLRHRNGWTVGEDVYVAFSPERVDPGNPTYQTKNIPKVVGGNNEASTQVAVKFYSQVIDTVVPVSSTRVAEMVKLLENTFRAVNIGLVNELALMSHRMNIDVWEVIDAAKTKPFGFMPFYPGPGLGGHCIPIDPFYLAWKARQHGVETRFIELAGEVNRAMPAWVVGKIAAALNSRDKPIKGSRILILGIAYKKNVDDSRESPAAEIMELLRAQGARLSYSDPHVPRFPRMREHRFDLASVEPSPQVLASQDAVVLVTDHDRFDYSAIAAHARLLIDTRGRYPAGGANIVKA